MGRIKGSGSSGGRTRCVGIVLGVMLASTAAAQRAPVDGMHYMWNSGTGFQGAVNATGGYAASVPLELPPARGNLPVPLQVVHGGKQVGAAGLGWEVPLSFITRHATTAKRRPAPQPFSANPPTPPVAPERMTLTLNGSATDLIRNAGNTAWVARRGDERIEVRENGDGLMVAYAGEGRTYNFSSRGATAGSRLMGGNLYLLTSIVDTRSNSAQLGYSIASPALPGGGAALAINLISVSYNQHPQTPGCFKNRIHLTYDAPAAQPLSISMRDGEAFARVQKLSAITVKGRAGCSGGDTTLSSYAFSYQVDADTRLPQLLAVTRTGQVGTAEQNVALPVATYSYGSIVDKATNKITLRKVQSAGPPIAPGSYDYGITRTSSTPSLNTIQHLLDLNGDGRSEFRSAEGNVYLNTSGAGGPVQFGLLQPNAFRPRIGTSGSQGFQTVRDTDRLYIDMNADGRVDFLETDPLPMMSWTLSLNTPDIADPNKSTWVERTIDASNARAAVASGSLTLGRTNSVSDTAYAACWVARSNGSGGLMWWSEPAAACPNFPVRFRSRMKTITESELRDVNGDGYPDLVYNASAVTTVVPPIRQPSFAPAHLGQAAISTLEADISGSRDIMVLINTAGVHLEDGVDPFSSPVRLVDGEADGCGVARWRPDPADPTGGRVEQVCGFQDINGDGIADRVTTAADGITTARLGTGDMTRPYSSIFFPLPGPLLRVESTLVLGPPGTHPHAPLTYIPEPCAGNPGPSASSFASTTAMLRDINGDGIPDYLRAPQPGPQEWRVSIGTGTGFAPEVSLVATDGLALRGALALEKSKCLPEPDMYATQHAGTTSGIFELDGDGQPEFVSLNAADQRWDIWQLKPPVAQDDVGSGVASIPAAGRITKIEYGYGASTRIGYRSAKEEWNTAHHVPFPEIVVESIATRDAGNEALLSTRRYAYRGANMIFDPAADAFRFAGYERTVRLDSYSGPGIPFGTGRATITDSHGLEPFDPLMDEVTRFRRHLLAGQTRSVVTLAGNVGTNPWDTLNADIGSDPRRSAGVHYAWNVRALPSGTIPAGNEPCLDMVYPYDAAASRNARLAPTADACSDHGFLHVANIFNWRGTPGNADAVTSSNTVQTNTEVTAIDDFGRTTGIRHDNDLARADDDVCVHVEFAEPTGTQERVLNAPAMKTTTDCAQPAKVLARTVHEYDTSPDGVVLPYGKVSDGRLTARLVSQIDLETGASTGPDIREFDAMYDVAGNPVVVSALRDDGALLETSRIYDLFRIAETRRNVSGVNADGSPLPVFAEATELDPLTLLPLAVTDANGTRRGRAYDGFQRVTRESIRPPAGSEGVLATLKYLGFEAGQTSGRRIVRKEFANPVPPSSADTAAGQSVTTYLDPLGRLSHTEVTLGADYGNKLLTVGKRLYDSLGRLQFEADPFEGTFSVHKYGTTHHYHPDGMPQCAYRAGGLQVYSPFLENDPRTRTNEGVDRLVSCSTHRYEDNQLIVGTSDAASRLQGSPQDGVVKETVYSAVNRVLAVQSVRNGSVLERMSFFHDPLGHVAFLTRHHLQNDEDLTMRWRYDSLGRAIEFTDVGSSPQRRQYDSWGGLVSSQWCDPTISPCSGQSPNRGTYLSYDAFGRVVRSEDRSNGSVVPETVRQFAYDEGVDLELPAVVARNVSGRLALATSATSSVAYGYDAFGRVETEAYRDLTTGGADLFVQTRQFNGDGTLKSTGFRLPDNGHAEEKADYAYDSARRMRSVDFSDGTTSRNLYSATGPLRIDALGRIRDASFGLNGYTAMYSTYGRQLPKSVKVSSLPSPGSTREYTFPDFAFDPVGRERVRKEIIDGAADAPSIESSYDALGRLRGVTRKLAGQIVSDLEFDYDDLGNIEKQQNNLDGAGALGTVRSNYDDLYRDRVCGIAFGGSAPPSACNVKYDAVGNIVEMPTRSGTTRMLDYFPGGQTRSATMGATTASFDYDAFGLVQRLALDSSTSPDTRRDKHFGEFIYQRDEVVSGVRQSVINRSYPGPMGLFATRHGAAQDAPWTFAFGEQRGTRYVTDETGAFVQDIDYQPFGEVRAESGAQPGSALYANRQWNGGDLLAALGVSQLGKRLYDPALGRFLSRDPIIMPRSANGTSPYSFAMNDPVNRADPSGLDCIGLECEGPIWGPTPPPGPGGGGGGAGGGGRPPSNECERFYCVPQPTTFEWPRPADTNTPSQKVGSGAHGFPMTPAPPVAMTNQFPIEVQQRMYEGMVRGAANNRSLAAVVFGGGESAAAFEGAAGGSLEENLVVPGSGNVHGRNFQMFFTRFGASSAVSYYHGNDVKGLSIGFGLSANFAVRVEPFHSYYTGLYARGHVSTPLYGPTAAESWLGTFHNVSLGGSNFQGGAFWADDNYTNWSGPSVGAGVGPLPLGGYYGDTFAVPLE